jgi:hypothetical protein
MDDIRKIRDENSLKYLSQSSEERKRESQKSLEWFVKAIGKPIEMPIHTQNGCPLLGIATDCGFTVDDFIARKRDEKVLECG